MSTAAQIDDAVRDAAPPSGVIDALSALFTSARTALSDILELLSLEARRAGLALMWMVVCGVIAAICIVATWLGLMAALALWLVSLGLPVLAAVLAVAVLNGLSGAVLIYRCVGMSRDLLFSATRRQLAPAPAVSPAKP